MKRLLIFILLSAPVLFSCKKQNAAGYIATDPVTSQLENATVASAGKFSFADERYDEGLAKIYLRKDGVYVLGLEQMNYQTAFNDTNVYLSATPELSTSSIKVFSAKKLHGNIYSTLTSINSIKQFKYLIIQADTDSQPVATAQLQ
jgi:hypothetical protein